MFLSWRLDVSLAVLFHSNSNFGSTQPSEEKLDSTVLTEVCSGHRESHEYNIDELADPHTDRVQHRDKIALVCYFMALSYEPSLALRHCRRNFPGSFLS